MFSANFSLRNHEQTICSSLPCPLSSRRDHYKPSTIVRTAYLNCSVLLNTKTEIVRLHKNAISVIWSNRNVLYRNIVVCPFFYRQFLQQEVLSHSLIYLMMNLILDFFGLVFFPTGRFSTDLFGNSIAVVAPEIRPVNLSDC